MTQTKGKCKTCGGYCGQCGGPIDVQDHFIPVPSHMMKPIRERSGKVFIPPWQFIAGCIIVGLIIDLLLGWL